MNDEKITEQISGEIRKMIPAFDVEHILAALNQANVFLFRYFPKKKICVMEEDTCQGLHCQSVYRHMPDDFCEEIVMEEDAALFAKMITDIESGVRSASVEFREKEGEKWWQATLTTVEWDEDHNPEICAGIVENHSDVKKKEQELKVTLSSIACGVLRYRMSDYKLYLANREALNILGYTTEEELAEDSVRGIAGTVLEEDRELIAKALSELKGVGDIKFVEYRVARKNSSKIRYCYGTVQIFYDANGDCIVQRSIMDITDRKKNDDLMQQIDILLRGISGGFIVCHDDEKFTFSYISEGAAAIQGYLPEELLKACGGNAAENILEEDRKSVLEEIQKQYAVRDTYSVKYRVKHKDGSVCWISDIGKKIVDTDGKMKHYSLFQDITELLQKNETLANFLTMQMQMVDSLSCGVFAYTLPEREVLIVNDESRRIFEYGTQDRKSFGRIVMQHVLPEDMWVVKNAVGSLKQPGDYANYKFRIRRKNKELLVIENHTKLLSFENGRQFILSVMQDVTKQEELKASLYREKKMYRGALTEGSASCISFDITEGIIQKSAMSDRGLNFVKLLGFNAPVAYDALCARFLEKYNIQLRDSSMEDFFFSEKLAAHYTAGRTSFEAEYYVPSMDSYYRNVLFMSEDEESGHIHALCVMTNTTEVRKKEEARRRELEEAREKLAVSNAELQAALDSEQKKLEIIGAIGEIYYAVYHINLDKGLFEAADGTEYSKGFLKNCKDAAVALERYIQTEICDSYRQKFKRFVNLPTLQMRMQKEKIISMEYQTTHSAWVRCSFIEVKRDQDGSMREVLFVSERIDEEKRKELTQQQALKEAYEAANRASEAKTNFLASMSHDIRTPMNGIIGMTAIAEANIEDRERVLDCLSKIAVSSRHLLGLINEVLDMNKIESGKLDLNVEEFNLSDVVESLVTIMKSNIEAKKQELTITIGKVEHENVIGDSQRIQQVFMNLLSNAAKYTPEGGKIEIAISEKPTNHERRGCYEFIFKDNGIGMSEEFVPQIFEPFTRAKDEKVEKMQGTGLGMAISRNIVRMMNGDIQVESRLGEGTKFTVTFFLELQDTREEESTEELRGLQVLIADGDQVVCERTCSVLSDLGMKGEWVLNGCEAVERAVKRYESGNRYFAVLLAWKMPEMDGVTAAKEIRRRAGDEIPIVIISKYDWSDIEMEGREAGANAFLSKPLFTSRIIRLFKFLLGNELQDTSGYNLKEVFKQDFSGKRVLLAEDNELNAEIAGEILGMAGLAVEFAENGKQAVEKITEAEDGYYDMVFMDIQMPFMNGYEATKAIRALPGNYAKRVPIIAMTANAFAEDVRMAKQAGMNEHIAKPLNFEELLKELNRWIT
ncbi:MAG: response regulator [Eubacterium sp.]|nr:response regulator [Eubacterium sp.]